MFNLVKDDFDENSDDILDSINKMIQNGKIEKNEEKSPKDEKNKENQKKLAKLKN